MAQSALIVIDMINTYDHDDAALLIPSVEESLPAVTRLLHRARELDVPSSTSTTTSGSGGPTTANSWRRP